MPQKFLFLIFNFCNFYDDFFKLSKGEEEREMDEYANIGILYKKIEKSLKSSKFKRLFYKITFNCDQLREEPD